jgi:hypothetical protein
MGHDPKRSGEQEVLTCRQGPDMSLLVYREEDGMVCELTGKAMPWSDTALIARCMMELKEAARELDEIPPMEKESDRTRVDVHLVIRHATD